MLNPFKTKIFELIKIVYKEKKTSFYLTAFSILGISFSGALLLLLVKFSTRILEKNQQQITVKNIFNEKTLNIFHSFNMNIDNFILTKSFILYTIPALFIIIGLLHATTTYLYQVNHQVITLYLTKIYY